MQKKGTLDDGGNGKETAHYFVKLALVVLHSGALESLARELEFSDYLLQTGLVRLREGK